MLAIGCLGLMPLLNLAGMAPQVPSQDDLLAMVRDAQRANLSKKYESGEIVAEIETVVGIVNDQKKRVGERRTNISCTMKWKGPKTFWDYEETVVRTEKGKQTENDTHPTRMLFDGTLLRVYRPDLELMNIIDPKKNRIPEALLIRPEESWYGG